MVDLPVSGVHNLGLHAKLSVQGLSKWHSRQNKNYLETFVNYTQDGYKLELYIILCITLIFHQLTQ